MNRIVLKGLGSNNTALLLQGFGPIGAAVSTLPGSYRGVKQHPIFRLLQRGLEVRQLYWRTEEICPMIVLVDTRIDSQSVPVKIAILNSANIEAKVPVAMLATESIEIPVMIAHPTAISIEARVPIAVSQGESVLGCLNIYEETEWAKMKPTAVFSTRELEIKSLDDIWFRPANKLEIIKSKELEFVRK